MINSSLALQLYSLRRETKADAQATVRSVPALGYDAVELAGTYDWPVEKWKQILAETKLGVVGAHCGLANLEKGWESQIEFQYGIGNRRLIISSAPPEMRTADGYREVANRLNALGKRGTVEKFSILYHNHAFEFEPLAGGKCGMELLLAETDPRLVEFEVDTYWVERGGRNALEFVEHHRARIGMIHAKELRKRDNADVPAGQGNVDFVRIIPIARQHGWPVVVEYEGENAPAAVAESARYLRTL